MLISGKLGSFTVRSDAFVFTKSVTINATKYVDIFGVISKSSRIYPGVRLMPYKMSVTQLINFNFNVMVGGE